MPAAGLGMVRLRGYRAGTLARQVLLQAFVILTRSGAYFSTSTASPEDKGQQALRLSPNDVVGCGQQLCTVSVLDLADWHLPLPRHLPAVRGALHCFVNTSSIVM